MFGVQGPGPGGGHLPNQVLANQPQHVLQQVVNQVALAALAAQVQQPQVPQYQPCAQKRTFER